MTLHAGRWPALLVAFLLAVAIGGPIVPVAAGDPDAVAPVIFSADGDDISGWWWLRDAQGAQRAAWRAFGTPVADVTLELELLATDGVGGSPGVDARFYLTLGPLFGDALGDAVLGPELTQLDNVSPLDDPVGYTNRGTVVIPAGSLPADADGVWLFIERRGPDGSVIGEHIAVRSESVLVHGLAQPRESLPPDATPLPSASPGPDATPYPPDGPPDGTPTIVALGDSYISGEAGRWAGNTNEAYTLTDALGATAYDQDPGVAALTGCHRSRSAEVHIGHPEWGPFVETINLACSGATTQTRDVGPSYKPGVDSCPGDVGCPDGLLAGQANLLYQVARTHNVDLVVLSIGGNDFAFSSTIEACVVDYLPSSTVDEDHCLDDAAVSARFSLDNQIAVTEKLIEAYWDVIGAMTVAGYDANDWTLLVQTYPSPLAPGGDIRYIESGMTRTRAGCPFWDEDADWANSTAIDIINSTVVGSVGAIGYIQNIKILDVRNILAGHRLCEDTVDVVETDRDAGSWRDANAADDSEWVAQIRGVLSQGGLIEVPGSVYQKVESFHPNYWGQLALRNCLRQAYNGGNVRGGECVFMQDGLNDRGEPQVILNE